MNQFHRAGRAQGRLGGSGILRVAHRLMGGQHQQGAQALTAVEHGVTHGIHQRRRGAVVQALRCLRSDPVVQGLLHLGQADVAPVLQIKRHAHWGFHALIVPLSST